MSILVTGASGRLGRRVIDALLERAPASEIIAASRAPDRLNHLDGKGVARRFCDFGAPESLAETFSGVTRALIISGMPPADIVSQRRAAFEAAARAGVRQIVYTSFPNPAEGSPAPPAGYQRASEAALKACGAPWTILRNAFYAELRVDIAPNYIRAGSWTTNMGTGGHAFVSRSDCAAAAAGALTSEGHEGKTYDITGPELIDPAAYTALLEWRSGRKVACRQVSDEAFETYRAAFEADPANANCVELYGGSGRAIREGWMSQRSTAVRDLSGRDPVSLKMLFEAGPQGTSDYGAR